jgi:hypothetical protein
MAGRRWKIEPVASVSWLLPYARKKKFNATACVSGRRLDKTRDVCCVDGTESSGIMELLGLAVSMPTLL